MTRKIIRPRRITDYLVSNPNANHQSIQNFIEENTQDIYLGWDFGSIYEALSDVDREDEYVNLSAAQKTKILEQFTDWVVNDGLADLERSLLEAIDLIVDNPSS
jgi:hypothetical protein